MGLFSEIFSWWGGNTWGTRLYTWRKGRLVGEDEFGNRYYVQNRGVGPLGVPARWVTYANLSEASQIPPEWHGWMHHTVDTLPTSERYRPKPWQLGHQMNLDRHGARLPAERVDPRQRKACEVDERLQALATPVISA